MEPVDFTEPASVELQPAPIEENGHPESVVLPVQEKSVDVSADSPSQPSDNQDISQPGTPSGHTDDNAAIGVATLNGHDVVGQEVSDKNPLIEGEPSTQTDDDIPRLPSRTKRARKRESESGRKEANKPGVSLVTEGKDGDFSVRFEPSTEPEDKSTEGEDLLADDTAESATLLEPSTPQDKPAKPPRLNLVTRKKEQSGERPAPPLPPQQQPLPPAAYPVMASPPPSASIQMVSIDDADTMESPYQATTEATPFTGGKKGRGENGEESKPRFNIGFRGGSSGRYAVGDKGVGDEEGEPTCCLEFVLRKKWVLLCLLLAVALTLIIVFVAVGLTAGAGSSGRRNKESAPTSGSGSGVKGTSGTFVLDHTLYCGSIEGKWDDGIAVFKGIPYTIPPTGDRRFRPSALPQGDDSKLAADGEDCRRMHWKKSPYLAHEFKSACINVLRTPSTTTMSMQGAERVNSTDGPGAVSNLAGSEDCLYLDVWSGAVGGRSGGKNLPVLVYLRGTEETDGAVGRASSELAKELGMVVVSVAYRVGVLGYLSVRSGTQRPFEATLEGNYGLSDQVTALKWVQTYIEFFGGDIESVMVIGSGLGASSIMRLLKSKTTTTLFHRAWMSGPSVGTNRDQSDTYSANLQYVQGLPCETVSMNQDSVLKCLQNKTAEELTESVLNPYQPIREELTSLPVSSAEKHHDTILFPDPPLAIRSDVDVLFSISSHEILARPPIFSKTALEQLMLNFSKYANVSEALLRRVYSIPLDTQVENATDDPSAPRSSDPVTPGSWLIESNAILSSMVTDVRYLCPLQHLAKNLKESSRSNSVLAYVSTNQASSAEALRNHQGFDIHAFFDVKKADVGDSEVNVENDSREYPSQVRAAVKRFSLGESGGDAGFESVTGWVPLLQYHAEVCTVY